MAKLDSARKTALNQYMLLAFVTTGVAVSSGLASSLHSGLVSKTSSSLHRAVYDPAPLQSVSYRTSTIPHFHLKAGHTYRLSTDEMGRIVGASNVQIPQGTIGVIANPLSGSIADQAEAAGWWEIDYPTGNTSIYGPSASQGWAVVYNTNSGLRITVPLDAPIATSYYVFYATHIVRLSDGHGGYFVDTYGPAANFDVISK